MSPNEEKLRAYQAAVNRQDIDGMLAVLHDDFVYRNMPYDRVMRGKDDKRKFFSWFTKGMSNYRLEVRHILCVGDLAFHEGVENYEKKGRKVCLPYAAVVEFRDGLIVSQRDYFDARTIEQQLGITPKAA